MAHEWCTGGARPGVGVVRAGGEAAGCMAVSPVPAFDRLPSVRQPACGRGRRRITRRLPLPWVASVLVLGAKPTVLPLSSRDRRKADAWATF